MAGVIHAAVDVIGSGGDADGFSISIAGRTHSVAAGVPISDSVTAGNHTVVLGGAAPHCWATGDVSEQVQIADGGSVTVAFEVECVGDITYVNTVDGESNLNHLRRDGVVETVFPGQAYRGRFNSDRTALAVKRFREIVLVRDGVESIHNVGDDIVLSMRWSPDGRYLSYTIIGGGYSEWRSVVRDVETGALTRLVPADPAPFASWAPDGTFIAFLKNSEGIENGSSFQRWTLYEAPTDSSPIRSLGGQASAATTAVSWDSRYIAYRGRSISGGTEVRVMDRETREAILVEPLINSSGSFQWSPTQNILAWEVGATGVRVWNQASGALTWIQGGGHPGWSPDGKWLVYHQAGPDSYGLWVVSNDLTVSRKILDGPGDQMNPVWNHYRP